MLSSGSPLPLVDWLQSEYGFLTSPEVSLIRSYTNDVYLVRQGEAKFVLKIYGLDWRTGDEIRYEIELLDHLSRAGLQVARAIGGTEPLPTPDSRLAVLYEYAPGETPERPFSNDLYVRFGQAIARMHALSDDFAAHHPRRAIDLDYLIDEPLEFILPLLTRPNEFMDAATQLRRRIADFPALDWGPIHGDATLDNLHVTEAGEITLYDFDSGGPGWRASDLQGWAVHQPEAHERYDAFRTGYASARRLQEQDLRASPLVTAAWEVWSIKLELERRVLQRGHDEAMRYAEDQAAQMMAQIKIAVG